MIHITNTKEIFSPQNNWLWLTSAFKAGFINSAGFLATGKFVSHVTGFGTQVGIALGHEKYFFGLELLIIPIAFIGGGVITSYMLDKKLPEGETPQYHMVQALITILIGLLILIGESGLVDSGSRFDADENYNIIEFGIIGLMCFICGLKNSLVTWSTYGKIRVTHLTGLSTDIGLHLIRTFKPERPGNRFSEERIVNITRILTFAFFSLGATACAIIFPIIGFKCFLIVMVISMLMTFVSFIDYHKLKIKQFSKKSDSKTALA
ncbi:MAG: DUF1275 domain-containing protein [Bacteriovoracaceae bacterium]|nr:DUF1275 domain-containing protein [Bacteriovoracaceae bacterium]